MGALVFDVGMHNGDDTAYYLASGYDVVAVDANPVFCEEAGERFRAEIATARLTIRNVGIAEVAGEFDFWVSDHSDWSSFHKENATKADTGALRIRVPTIQFSDLLGDYRAPVYVKVDIERNDSLCIRELARCEARPPYFSFEANPDAAEDVDVLVGLGYTSFKCIRQNDWREISPENMHRQALIAKLIQRVGAPRVVTRLHYRARSVNGWDFALGSSGPFGRELPGRWLSRDEVLTVWEHLFAMDRGMAAGGRGGEWFDIHAAATPS